jgi:hypothetical protein
MIPSKLALTPFTEGDTWEGLPSVTIRVNDAAPASPISTVTMRFKKAGAVPSEVIELSSDEPAEINITDAEGWVFAIPEQALPGLTFGKWIWRIRVTDAAGEIRTYLADELTVLETV